MIAQLGARQALTTGPLVRISAPLGDDENSAPPGAPGRLHYELRTASNQLREAANVAITVNDRVGFRRRDAVLAANLFRQDFVIDPRVEAARRQREQ